MTPFGLGGIGRRAMLGLAAALAIGAVSARATPYLVVDADSDQVLAENASTAAWYPASLTKLMTVYVALDAVRSGKLTLDTPLVMSGRAARMPPSKMGFRPGTEVTLDNALKMLMVKSPNDVAVMVAEGVSGSVEAFANDMNAAGERLGLRESHFVNPNGLHDPAHVSSARDMAIIARALLREFPDHADLFSIGALQLGNQYIANHNGLLGRYPGADGMKTGFTCPAGFNVVASANHSGRRLIVVVLGAPTCACAATRPRSPPPKTRASPSLSRPRRPRAAGARSPTRSRRCSRRRTPNSRTKGSVLIRSPFISVPPRAGRVRRSAPVRPARRQRPTMPKA
jgi:D-alanyl-D-alanine carboxypeptidase